MPHRKHQVRQEEGQEMGTAYYIVVPMGRDGRDRVLGVRIG